MILTVGGIKGGTGKTTIATNLACIATRLYRVLLVDADEQGTAADFAAVRAEEHPASRDHFTTIKVRGEKVRSEVLKLAPQFTLVVIDTGGRDTTSQRAALSLSHKLIVPFIPRSFDLWTVQLVVSLVKEIQRINPTFQAFSCINRADPVGYGDETETAVHVLRNTDEVLKYLDAPLGNRKAFANAASKGLAVTELRGNERNPKASDEMLKLCERCLLRSR